MRSAPGLWKILALFLGCASQISLVTPSRDLPEMRAQILRILPLGSPQEEARRVLERSGFTVEWMEDTSFMESNRTTYKEHPHLSFLYGYLDRPADLFFSEKWQVALVMEKGRLREVYLSYGTMGP